ncbi:hypothetical protein Nepgr_014956 [Nepenthes gracilis]|uniref:Uncharacterized protein n=1 Tax=Nepenthes gracilis TaxID=150966 RepID=A0AAD3SK84_NEPGR|nr:hypothetical protein Nepgr_014956 [Nepenthes gracilis]
MALRRRDATVGAIPNSVERLGKEDEGCPTSHSNPLESTHVNMSSCSLEKETVSHSRYLVAPANGDSGSFLFMTTEDSLSLVHSKDMCQELAENDKFPNQASGEAVVKVPHGEKTGVGGRNIGMLRQ